MSSIGKVDATSAPSTETRLKFSRRITSLCGTRPAIFDVDASFTAPIPLVPHLNSPQSTSASLTATGSIIIHEEDFSTYEYGVLLSWLLYGVAASHSSLAWDAPFAVISLYQYVDGLDTLLVAHVHASESVYHSPYLSLPCLSFISSAFLFLPFTIIYR